MCVCVCVLDSQTYCLCGDRFVCVCRHKRLHTISNFMCVSNTQYYLLCSVSYGGPSDVYGGRNPQL